MVPHHKDRESGDRSPREGSLEMPWEVAAEEIAREIHAIQRDSYGGGAAEVKAFLVADIVIVLLDGLELMPNEEFLIANGDSEIVQAIRSRYQLSIEETFRAAVERATGRTVIGFSSHTHLDEVPFAVELFRLLPREDG